jgi:hypothetical protein
MVEAGVLQHPGDFSLVDEISRSVFTLGALRWWGPSGRVRWGRLARRMASNTSVVMLSFSTILICVCELSAASSHRLCALMYVEAIDTFSGHVDKFAFHRHIARDHITHHQYFYTKP